MEQRIATIFYDRKRMADGLSDCFGIRFQHEPLPPCSMVCAFVMSGDKGILITQTVEKLDLLPNQKAAWEKTFHYAQAIIMGKILDPIPLAFSLVPYHTEDYFRSRLPTQEGDCIRAAWTGGFTAGILCRKGKLERGQLLCLIPSKDKPMRAEYLCWEMATAYLVIKDYEAFHWQKDKFAYTKAPTGSILSPFSSLGVYWARYIPESASGDEILALVENIPPALPSDERTDLIDYLNTEAMSRTPFVSFTR